MEANYIIKFHCYSYSNNQPRLKITELATTDTVDNAATLVDATQQALINAVLSNHDDASVTEIPRRDPDMDKLTILAYANTVEAIGTCAIPINNSTEGAQTNAEDQP